MKKNSRLRTWPFWLLGIILALILFVSLLLNLAAVAVLAGSGEPSNAIPEDEYPSFEEVASFGSEGPKVIRIDLTEEITRSDATSTLLGSTSHDRVEAWLRQIRCAAADPKVKGLLIEVDSPGGGITASDELYHEFLRFKESDSDRVIVALVHDMAASGAYYAILPADKIIAQPTSLVGSVGVLLSSVNAADLARKLGIQDATLTSGPNKDAMNPLKPLDPAQVALLQAEIDTMYDRFLGLVAQHRHVSRAKLREVCDGRVLGAQAALDHKLIDQIGYREDALDVLATLLKADSVRVIRYQAASSFLDDLLGLRSALTPISARIARLLGADTSAGRLQARYAP